MTATKTRPAVGIDLGTTFSAVAILDAVGRPETIRNSEGDLTTPSAVFFDHKRPIVGIEAVEAGLLEPDRLAQYAKRDVGEDFYEKQIRGKHLPAEVIQALILRKLKEDAELKLGEVNEAVVTVPAFFNEPCRKATQDAGRLAGLKVLDIINEPTAAAITYGVQHGFLNSDGSSEKSETVLVYDLGGGTFDVTVMEIDQGNFNTIATAGDVYLGGIDWDSRIVDFIAESFASEHGIDPRDDPQSVQELLRKANQAKHALTQRDAVTVAFAQGGRRMRAELSQREFSDRCADLVERTLLTVQLVLDDANVEWSNLTRLILVGGSTRMPMIRDELERLSGMELDRSLSPDEAVSHGAAIYAGMLLSGKKDQSGISVSNVNSHDLGVMAVDPTSGEPRRQIMIPRNSRLPARKMVRFRTHKDNQANVKIEIVEGGDDRGFNVTKIGRCIVDDIPRGTAKGTHVDVRFDYRPDGRLTIHACLPEIDRKVAMTLDRAAGLTDDEIECWMTRLDSGLSDAMLAGLPESDEEGSGENATASLNELPADRSNKDVDDPSVNTVSSVGPPSAGSSAGSGGISNAASVLNMSSVPLQSPPDEASSPSTGKEAAPSVAETNAPMLGVPPNIDVGDKLSSETGISAEDARQFPVPVGSNAEVVREKPDLELDPKDASAVSKADPSDLSMLASLAGTPQKAKPTSSEVPFIVTDSSAVDPQRPANEAPDKKEKSKKSGGLFGRKRK